MQASQVGDVAPLSARQVAALREKHVCTVGMFASDPFCDLDKRSWPCDAVRLLATLEAATAAARREGFEAPDDDEDETDAWQGAYDEFIAAHPKYKPGLPRSFRLGFQAGARWQRVRAAQVEPPRRAGEAAP